MLTEMMSPAFKENGKERPPIRFKENLNVVLGKDDGEMSIGKSSALLAIDFVFGGDTYMKSDVVKHEGHHTIFFTFTFQGKPYHFARNTSDGDKVHKCSENYQLTGNYYSKSEFADWLKAQYEMDFIGLSFRITLSSFFRIYGKDNTDEHRPLRGIPGQDMDKSISMLLALFDKYKDIEVFKLRVTEQKKKLDAYRDARKYDFVSNLVGGRKKYEENLLQIHALELQLAMLTEEAEKGHTDEEIEKNKQKAILNTQRLNIESAIQSQERKLRLLNMSLEYGLYPTEADMLALQEFFPEVNLRKLYEIEKYHQKLAKILDDQFLLEKAAVKEAIVESQAQLMEVKEQISQLGFVGNISIEFLDRHSEIKGEISALATQNQAYLKLTELQEAKASTEDILKRSIEVELNTKMKEFNDTLFAIARKPPHVKFNRYNSYTFETPDDTGTGSNYKGMIVYELAVLFTTALPAIAHDSLVFKNLAKDVEDGIMKIYKTSKKQIFIAYDKQKDCRPDTQQILEENMVLKLSDNGCELYGRAWNKEE